MWVYVLKSISIIGCGWFGLPLASSLAQNGLRVIGTKRNSDSFESLISKGIKPVEFDLSTLLNQKAEVDYSELLKANYLLICIPPRARAGNKLYLEELKYLLSLLNINHYEKIIFISSTGVYPNDNKMMTEECATQENHGNSLLFEAEKLFLRLDNAVIVRFSGLIGPLRHPGRFFSNKAEVDGGSAPVNLVHLTDCINAIKELLNADNTSPIYNLCIPHHPTKSEFYKKVIESLDRKAPMFVSRSALEKRIDGSLITKETNFKYSYNNLYDAVQYC